MFEIHPTDMIFKYCHLRIELMTTRVIKYIDKIAIRNEYPGLSIIVCIYLRTMLIQQTCHQYRVSRGRFIWL